MKEEESKETIQNKNSSLPLEEQKLQNPRVEDQLVLEYGMDTIEEKRQVPFIEKNNGSILARRQQFDQAIAHFNKALLALKVMFEDKELIETEELSQRYIEEVDVPCASNLALCYLKPGQYGYAVQYASRVLSLYPDNTKALFRRGKAYLAQGKHEEASEDLKRAYALCDGKDSSIVAALRELRERKVAYEEKSKQMFQQMVNNPRSEDPEPQNKSSRTSYEKNSKKTERCISWFVEPIIKRGVQIGIYSFNKFCGLPLVGGFIKRTGDICFP